MAEGAAPASGPRDETLGTSTWRSPTSFEPDVRGREGTSAARKPTREAEGVAWPTRNALFGNRAAHSASGPSGIPTVMAGPAGASNDCFVIMPIGRPETDAVWTEVYAPALTACGLNPLRSDTREDGRPLPTQIRERIVYAALVIGDLTFARPNCYYEVGLAMALKRYPELILCCREDHKPGRSEHVIHFDVVSYNVVWWDPAELPRFASELKSKIGERLEILEREVLRSGATPAAAAAKVDLSKLKDLVQRVAHREERELARWKRDN